MAGIPAPVLAACCWDDPLLIPSPDPLIPDQAHMVYGGYREAMMAVMAHTQLRSWYTLGITKHAIILHIGKAPPTP